MQPISVLGISGSLRQGSFNTALLRAAQGVAPAGMSITIADLSKLPFYDGDIEVHSGIPAAAEDLRARIRAADAVLIASPEYNGSFTGVLKNAIDWASRPPHQAFAAKPVAIMGASGGSLGTVRSQLHLRDVLTMLDARLVNAPQVFVAAAQNKIEDGTLKDEPSLGFIRTLLENLAAWVTTLRG
ncbi:MAG: NAD(P)H-dependent oxidoreductase [Rhodospirillales bacterium]|nr:NAD(P)H-dependent oxidoreductase [Rhodospirillales bacterium]